ncbi:MAG: Permease of the major facilitator superfamily [uncultured Thiotrichaceae bacterium]|uniref:Permease of the major facilitator superfamily n=1 Tax=uncultured Thiotrichaceae bacterium TaxID=298394 RepID=A0A6S6T6Y9_9GAMM|nr:MAG: Permease of the major facilitator superfamily [uncultured Thiotrichaceae bacterium]
MTADMRNYFVVTGGYWAFTLTDGAIRMLVVLYFHLLGYSPFEVAMLFLFYEFFGIVTNLVGGWLASRLGLNVTMHLGMGLQVIALGLLTVPEAWLSVPYVMMAQAMSGIAKDLNKMSAKASVKSLVPSDADARLFKWVALLTGSKNALKGVGFFLGALLLQVFGFQNALLVLATGLSLVLLTTYMMLPKQLGKSKTKSTFTQVFSNNAAINWLSAARFFLFGARDVWFVVAVPVFLYEVLEWSFTQVGTFMALWVIGYGFVQASAPKLLGMQAHAPTARTAQFWAMVLCIIPGGIALGLMFNFDPEVILIAGLFVFGIVFAINSAIHSYLILAYSDHDKVALKVGFYYMANAGGRLLGTVLSGLVYQQYGLEGCLWFSSAFVLLALVLSLPLSGWKNGASSPS